MSAPSLLQGHGCVGLGHKTLLQLRAALETPDTPPAVALQSAGFAGGEELASAFGEWTRARYHAPPAELDVTWFAEALGGFLSEFGWGTVSTEQLSPGILAIDSPDWAEARGSSGASYPSCHLSTGLLAEFLSQVGGAQVAVLQVECLSCGDPRCRFLVGSAESLTTVYERMAAGGSYREGLG